MFDGYSILRASRSKKTILPRAHCSPLTWRDISGVPVWTDLASLVVSLLPLEGRELCGYSNSLSWGDIPGKPVWAALISRN
eukprot:gene1237-biopygen9554